MGPAAGGRGPANLPLTSASRSGACSLTTAVTLVQPQTNAAAIVAGAARYLIPSLRPGSRGPPAPERPSHAHATPRAAPWRARRRRLALAQRGQQVPRPDAHPPPQDPCAIHRRPPSPYRVAYPLPVGPWSAPAQAAPSLQSHRYTINFGGSPPAPHMSCRRTLRWHTASRTLSSPLAAPPAEPLFLNPVLPDARPGRPPIYLEPCFPQSTCISHLRQPQTRAHLAPRLP
jgi:hypothetical protein